MPSVFGIQGKICAKHYGCWTYHQQCWTRIRQYRFGCSLCAAACPSDCIRVVPAENTPDNRVSAGERHARIYEINMARCIFCGYCELACPFDAITLGNDFELSEISRDALVYTKSMLLEKPALRTPSQAVDPYDVPSQEMERVLGMYDITTATNPEGAE